MKNKVIISLLIITLISNVVLYFFVFTSGPKKIAYVDSGRLLNSYVGMKEARKEFQKKSMVWQANIDTLMSDIQTKILDHEKSLASMSKKEKDLSKQLIQAKQKELAQYQEAIRQKAVEEDQKMTGAVLNQINAYLEKYGEDHDYSIVFAATNAGNIVYSEDTYDITDQVLEGLNVDYVAN